MSCSTTTAGSLSVVEMEHRLVQSLNSCLMYAFNNNITKEPDTSRMEASATATATTTATVWQWRQELLCHVARQLQQLQVVSTTVTHNKTAIVQHKGEECNSQQRITAGRYFRIAHRVVEAAWQKTHQQQKHQQQEKEEKDENHELYALDQRIKHPRTSAAATDPPPSSSSSFSIMMDSLNGSGDGGWLASMITVEDIRLAETLHDQLSLLQKVHYLDDLTQDETDWNYVLSLLRQELSSYYSGYYNGSAFEPKQVAVVSQTQPVASTPTSSTMIRHDHCESLALLMKWMDMAKTSMGNADGFRIQLDLVHLLVSTWDKESYPTSSSSPSPSPLSSSFSNSGLLQIPISKYITSDADNNWTSHRLCQCVVSTWIDWMLKHPQSRSDFISDRSIHQINSIGKHLWNLSTTSYTTVQSNEHNLKWPMMQVDPTAEWFALWLEKDLITGQELIHLLFPVVDDEYTCKGKSNPFDTRISLLSPSCSSMDRSVYYHWLAIVHALLVRLRVSNFPWNHFHVGFEDGNDTINSNDDNNNSNNTSRAEAKLAVVEDSTIAPTILAMAEVFLQALVHLQKIPINKTSVLHCSAKKTSADFDVNDKSTDQKIMRRMTSICVDSLDTIMWGCCGPVSNNQNVKPPTLAHALIHRLRIRIHQHKEISLLLDPILCSFCQENRRFSLS